MMEYEIKIMLTPQEHSFLLHNQGFRWEAVCQTNYYYDNDDFDLSAQGITCRIREKNGHWVATVKQHQVGQENSFERSYHLKGSDEDAVFTEIGFRCQGRLETWRAYHRLCHGVEIMLDENSYLGVRDYELEIEYDPDMRSKAVLWLRDIATFLRKNGVVEREEDFLERISKGDNKSVRFAKRKKEMRYIGI